MVPQRVLAVVEPTMTIGGRGANTSDHIDVIKPATEQVCGRTRDCSPEQFDASFAAAAAFPAWSGLEIAQCGKALDAAADALEGGADELAVKMGDGRDPDVPVNSHLALTPSRPFGGAKWSGLRTEGGRWGYEELVQLKVEYLARGGSAALSGS